MLKLIKRYTNQSLIIIFANSIFSLSQFLLISTMIKMYDLNTVGTYTYAMALIVPIITFSGLNLRALQLTDVTNRYKFADFFVLRIFGAVVTVLIVLAILLSTNTTGYALIISSLVLIRKIIELFIEATHSKLIREGKYKQYSLSLIFIGTFSILAFVLTSYLTESYIYSLASYTLVWLLVFLLYDSKNINIKNEFKEYAIKLQTIYHLTIAALPLALVSMINVMYTNIPQIMIKSYVNIEAVGIFSSILYIALIGNIFITGITLVFSTKLADINQRGDLKKFFKIVFIQIVLVLLACFIMFILFYVAGNNLLTLLYSSEFIDYKNLVLLVIVAITMSFTAKIFGSACTSAHKNSEQFYVALTCIAILVLSSFYLIPKFSLFGAGIALTLTYASKNILLFTILFRHYTSIIKK